MNDVSEAVTIVGELSEVEIITGELTVVDFALHPLEDGEGFQIVDSNGNIITDWSPEEQVEALHGEITIPEVIDRIAYEGAYTVTPGAEAIILPTEDLLMRENVTINPVPSNYGLITWDGSTLTVS